MYSKYILIFFLNVTECILKVSALIPIFDIDVENRLKMQQGLGWPHSVYVAEGHEALLKLSRPLVNQQSCLVTTPSGLTFNVRSPPNNRFESWGDDCGVRVRNVVAGDEGRWRLTAIRGNDSITGWSEIYVKEDVSTYTALPISLQDGQTHTHVELSSLDNTYCVVAQPFSESSLVPGHCGVTLDRATRAVQGNWSVLIGIPGQVSELQLERHVAVEAERLDVGYIRDTSANKLHLYCNIIHTSKNITFCRFQKTSGSYGYNVIDGLSDGVHSYYGEGFLKRHCGLTIENPIAQDSGTWRCSVGVQQWVNEIIQQQSPMQALISVGPAHSNLRVNRHIQSNTEEVRQIFVQNDMSFTIMCRANVSLTYCWFQHPNGSQYTPVQLTDDDQMFWYTGENLQMGDCGITFPHVTEDDAGMWTCHMGPNNQLGIEITDRVIVRVTGPLAAHDKEVAVVIGETAILYCHSSRMNRPLGYCRFLTPKFVGLSVDSSVTKENAILDRFYFTPESNLDHGDCSLTISPVLEEDLGEWTCAAQVNEEILESRDTITVYIAASSSRPRLVASIVGMSVGLLVLTVALLGYLWFKRGRPLPFRNSVATSTNSQANIIVGYDRHSTVTNTGSIDSDNSNNHEIIVRT